MAFSGFAGALAGAAGGLLGGALDAHYDRELTRMNQAWQKEVYQNQLQWRASDAKKAGLHPLAALGSSVSSPSNIVSSGSTDFSKTLGKLGEGIGDSIHAYMTKDEREAVKAENERQANRSEYWDDLYQLGRGRLLDAQTEYYSALAMKTAREARAYTNPMADGSEVIGGQTDANIPKKFERYRNPDGSLSGRLPTQPYQSLYDDKKIIEYKPGLEALYWDTRDFLASKFGLWDFRGSRYGY